ncbi:hypothetical protein OS128_04450 [Corynebacterium sp. P5848]|uniref:hypothetical protein n=1 Tax=Corynebacterium marambiense TaxID=2765364 RepID=UPI002260FA37|nr:hypothetical protein [Corynebacterium marambiense]MCX7542168.1 hypothetical protein [Corynebacterium marambiense]
MSMPATVDHDTPSTVQDLDAAIFDGSARLEQIRAFARYRSVSPVGLLVSILVRVSCALPPAIQVDAGQGPGSLNLFAAIIGPPASGKSKVMNTADQALTITGGLDYPTLTPGSGEGIITAYTRGGPDNEPVPSVLWQEEEVTNLGALADRKGATLKGFLTKMYDAGALSVTNKNESYAAPGGSYRAGFLLGVQPGRADILLRDEHQGFPQRFIWARTTDPGRQRNTDYPEVRPIPLKIPTIPGGIIDAGPEARETLRRAADQRLIDGADDGLDGHRSFTQIKVAALLAVLLEHSSVTDDDWDRATRLMRSSDRARALCTQHRDRQREKQRVAKLADEEAVARQLRGDIRSKILRQLEKNFRGQWVNSGKLRARMPGEKWRGDEYTAVIEDLIDQGVIEKRVNPQKSEHEQYQLSRRAT